MPKFLHILSSKQDEIYIGTKEDFVKLQLKHAVVGNDSAEIRKAVEKIEKLGDSIYAIADYVKPYHELLEAVKAFKAQYARKHPKFISAVESDFVAPVQKVIDKGSDQIGGFRNLPDQFNSCAEIIDDVVDELSKQPYDDAILKSALDKLGAAGSTFTNALRNARELSTDFHIEVLDLISKKGEAERGHFEEIAKILTLVRKQNAYTANLAAIGITLGKLKNLTQELARAVEQAKV